MSSGAARLRDRLRGVLIAAAATPMTASGEVDLDIVETYLRGLVTDGAGALAVLAHTGRGPYLTDEVRAGVIARAVGTGVPVIVGVGGSPGGGADEQAAVAAGLGAQGALVFPDDGDRLARHDAVWRASGLPMIAFDLYTRPCPPAVLRDLVRHPGVAGLKSALLFDAMGCQRAIAVAREAGRLAVTGEDRMFAPSLMWGAQAALVGLAAAAVGVTREVLCAFEGADLARFLRASERLDRLAAATFTEPMEGYVQRMLWVAAAEGRVPASHAHDPYGPPLPGESPPGVPLAALG
ncbi:dihydrodipicolinate synthase family protein [Spongiactinospora sp. TRM90649]|uniref:dihydrodipicolinate synthase family protein n=1 Tax=Spongiactinospora sp. TRM90649 TaxID=3031114 RepID=UPI0023F71C16|nr:dihydrodipicolinate synthase family protein [Spongiactinospora sp. TRM90649]MDF5753707.1 dihydrodipicolinate synthase family protein [Spongiactinospora sp. TRM90649]